MADKLEVSIRRIIPSLKESMTKKITKQQPFDLDFITADHSNFAHLLRGAISQIYELPDFSDDKRIAVMSDFSGEHKGASFNTYSFLILAYDKIGPFRASIEGLRRKHGIFLPYSEFAFKDLFYGPRLAALPEFLSLVDTLLHGAVVTLAVDRRIGTVFGGQSRATQALMVKQLSEAGFGCWSGADAEKVMRICHFIAMFVSLMTNKNHQLFWYCDNDNINADGKSRTFGDTQKIFANVLGLYCKQGLKFLGFAKSFQNGSHLDDLLSVADFAAGVTQDILQSHYTGNDEIPGELGKLELIKWIGRKSQHLTKLSIQLAPLPNGDIGSGIVTITGK